MLGPPLGVPRQPLDEAKRDLDECGYCCLEPSAGIPAADAAGAAAVGAAEACGAPWGWGELRGMLSLLADGLPCPLPPCLI